MTYANSARRFMAVPLLGFDWVRQFCIANPRAGNWALFYASFFAVMVAGKGAEKLTCSQTAVKKFEGQEAFANRMLPFFVSDYRRFARPVPRQ